MLIELLKERNMSIYQCSKLTGIPYTTLSELVNGKTNITNQSAIDIIKLFADIVLSINKSNLNADFFKTMHSKDLVNILSPAYIGKGNLKVTSISGSQLNELYRIFICNDDIYNQEVLSFFIKPIHK